MLHFEKAVACVVQDHAILCFRHPFAGNQIPKGTLEPGEKLEEAVVRELWEEAGVQFSGSLECVGTIDRLAPGGHRQQGPLESQRWHLFVMPMTGLPANWTHQAIGSAEEEGLPFEYFWQRLDTIPQGFEDVFIQVIERVKTCLSAADSNRL